MNTSYYVAIAEMIENNYDTFDGFVVLTGSDTMSYIASALSFMLENLTKPIIFTGSQLPIGDLRTDAKENLLTSIQLASLQHDRIATIKEVGIYFEYKLYRANRTTKINAENFKAFSSFNYPSLAKSGVHLKINTSYLWQPRIKKALFVHKKLNQAVVVIKLFPGISKQLLDYMLHAPDIRGVVLETFGSGNTGLDSGGSGIETYNTSTLGMSSGKYYMEFKISASSASPCNGSVGVINGSDNSNMGTYLTQDNSVYQGAGYQLWDGNRTINQVGSSFGATIAAGDIVGMAIDMDNKALYFHKNGTYQNSGSPTSGASKTGAIDFSSLTFPFSFL